MNKNYLDNKSNICDEDSLEDFILKLDNEIFDDVFLMKGKVEEVREYLIINNEKYYPINGNIVLTCPKESNNSSFSIYNLDYIVSPRYIVLEIVVEPENSKIELYTTHKEDRKLRLRASFDKESDEWDIRSFVEKKNVPSDLRNTLLKLLLQNKTGVYEFNGYYDMLTVTKKMMNKNNDDNNTYSKKIR